MDSFGKGRWFPETMLLYELDNVEATHPLTAKHCWIWPVLEIQTMELTQCTKHAAVLPASCPDLVCMILVLAMAVSNGHVYTHIASEGTSVDHRKADR
mmetsp:Transcript_8222/g.20327  ORF Transcript_8222/g.20327 Transcript_8222/m.20327 type:complete len:98 (+) Transcript_8222:109-402(+)